MNLSKELGSASKASQEIGINESLIRNCTKKSNSEECRCFFFTGPFEVRFQMGEDLSLEQIDIISDSNHNLPIAERIFKVEDTEKQVTGPNQVWCNRQRLHSSLGYKSPVQYESGRLTEALVAEVSVYFVGYGSKQGVAQK